MTTSELGKRIKEARLAKKMTQSEVVGTFITRNMLSQIESGVASPSIKTLEYLSKALDIPMNQLMSEDNPTYDENISAANTPNTVTDIYVCAKKSYLAKNYSSVIELLDKNMSSDMMSDNNCLYDEITALLAISYYHQAVNLSSTHSYSTSIDYAKKAIELSTKGLFANMELKTKSLLLLDEILKKQFSDDNISI